MAVLDDDYQIIGGKVVDVRAANREGIDFAGNKESCETIVGKYNSKFIGSVCYANSHMGSMDVILSIGSNINYNLMPNNFEFKVQ